MRKLLCVLSISLIAGISTVSSTEAAPVTIGPSLAGSWTPQSCGEPCSLMNNALDEPTAVLSSPVTGAVIRWRIIDATTASPYTLHVLSREGPTRYVSTGSATATGLLGTGIQTFAAAVPIKAGQTIGLDEAAAGDVGTRALTGGEFLEWRPPFPEDVPQESVASGALEIGLNADIQPAPTVSGIGVTTGPLSGGTSVPIQGTDFAGVNAVSFGATPAASFTVDSEGLITAVSPSNASAGSVPVSVTTVAGTAGSTQPFAYQAPALPPSTTPTPPPTPPPTCVVPKLKGMKLRATEKKIRAADCKVGKVTKRKGANAATGKVIGQTKKPGTVLPAGSVVKVTLGKK